MSAGFRQGCVLGIDLGGTKIAAGLVDGEGKVLTATQVPTRALEGPEAALERLVAAVQRMAGEAGLRPLAAGIGAAGSLDLRAGRILQSPNLPGWDGFPLRQELARRLGIPLWVDNDANVAALAEARLGAGQGARVMVYVGVGTGIGGGLVLDGRLFGGANGNGLEVGHMVVDPEGPPCGCGQQGCWETMASGTALAREAQAQLGPPPGAEGWSAAQVLAAAAGGRADARGLVDRFARWLGLGLANVVHAFNPDRVVLGGGVMARYHLLEPVMAAEVQRRLLPGHRAAVQLLPAALGPRAGLVGAALRAWDGLGGN